MFLLHELSTINPKELVGQYKVNGLAILQNSSGYNTDRIKKRIINLFQKFDLKITIKANIIQTDFLDSNLTSKQKSTGQSENRIHNNYI